MKLICHDTNGILTFDHYLDNGEFRKRYIISNLNVVEDIKDFKWLFDFLSTIFIKFNIFSNCKVKYEEFYSQDEWDRYCNIKITHTFSNSLTLESYYYDLEDEYDKFTDVSEILNFISNITNIEIKYYYE